MSPKSTRAAALVGLAALLFVLAVLEISFPQTFAWSRMIHPLRGHGILIGILEVVCSGALLWPAFRADSVLAGKLLETLARIGLGGMFVFASWFKIQNPLGFAMLIAQYQFLPSWAVNLFALVLPQMEFWTGLAIVFTPWSREAASLLLLMFAAFIVALGQAVARHLGITCGCFELDGALDKREAWISLVRDIILLAPTLWLVRRPSRGLWAVWKID